MKSLNAPRRPRAVQRRRLALAVAVAIVLAGAVPAAAAEAGPDRASGVVDAGSATTLNQRIAMAQRDLDSLDRRRQAASVLLAQASGDAFGNPASARLDVRLSALEQEVREMTGRIERLQFDVRQLDERIEKVVGDLEYRVGGLEQGTGQRAPSQSPATPGRGGSEQAATPPSGASPGVPAESPDATPPAPGSEASERVLERPGVLATVPRAGEERPDTTAPGRPTTGGGSAPTGTPQQQYAYAFDLLRSSDYERAEGVLKSFLAQNPEDPLADNARYWLGETYYVRGLYAEAAQTFADAYKNNDKGPKAADALLKLGMSLARLDKNEEACATFRELSRAQPDAPEAITTKATQERERMGCI